MDQINLTTTRLVGRLHPVPAGAIALAFAILCVLALGGLQHLTAGSTSSLVQMIDKVAGIVLVAIVLPIGFVLPFTLQLQITIHHREHHVIQYWKIYGIQAVAREYFVEEVLVKKNRTSGLHGGRSREYFEVSVIENGEKRPIVGSFQSVLFGGVPKQAPSE